MRVKFQINGREMTGTVEEKGWFNADQTEEAYSIEIDGKSHIRKIIAVSQCEAIN